MTPIPFPLPSRILPPTTAYAAGLVCEQRPDLADGVRCAVLGSNAVAILDTMMLARVKADDGRGISALSLLRSIVRCEGKMNVNPMLADLANAVYDSFDWHPALDSEHADLALQLMYWRLGFGPCWEHAKTPNDLRGLRRLTPIHAHTVSLDADARAAWAKAHLDALGAA